MQNLDQIRAKNALAAANDNRFTGANDGDIVKKVPTMIMNNGILAAAAFANEDKGGYSDVFRVVIEHLKSVNRLPGQNTELLGFINDLCCKDSAVLRDVTAESIAYLSYLRRFAKKNKDAKAGN